MLLMSILTSASCVTGIYFLWFSKLVFKKKLKIKKQIWSSLLICGTRVWIAELFRKRRNEDAECGTVKYAALLNVECEMRNGKRGFPLCCVSSWLARLGYAPFDKKFDSLEWGMLWGKCCRRSLLWSNMFFLILTFGVYFVVFSTVLKHNINYINNFMMMMSVSR